MNTWIQSFKLFIMLTIMTGVAYPLALTGISKVLFAKMASGQFIEKDGKIIGSRLIAQKFESDRYFWPRPSAVDYNPIPSGGTNLGPISQDLKKQFEERKKKFDGTTPPQDLLFASASGLDPHISEESARFQVTRISRSRNMPEDRLVALVDKCIEDRDWGIFGEKRVNVLELNLVLDKL